MSHGSPTPTHSKIKVTIHVESTTPVKTSNNWTNGQESQVNGNSDRRIYRKDTIDTIVTIEN